VAAIAARQHGVITVVQLLVAGLSRAPIERPVRSGRLVRLSRGVYAIGHAGLSPKGHLLAAVFACGPSAALACFHAASLLQVSRSPALSSSM